MVIIQLLDRQADIRACKYQALKCAFWGGHYGVAQLLLDRGAFE